MSLIGRLLQRRDPPGQVPDPMRFVYRARLMQARVQRLHAETKRASPERVEAIAAEVELILQNMHDLREEQLVDVIERRR